MESKFSVIIEKDSEGMLVASVPELYGCHTQAQTMDVLLERVREAILLCLDEHLASELYGKREFIGVEHITLSSWSAPHA